MEHHSKKGLQEARSAVLERLGRFCFARRWVVVGAWVLFVAAFVVAGRLAGGGTSTEFSVPGAESQRAFDLLEKHFPLRSGATADIVFRAPGGIDDPRVRGHMETLFARVEQLPHVLDVASPYADQPTVSPDRTIAFATVQFDSRENELIEGAIDEFKEVAGSASTAQVQVELGGRLIQFSEIEGPGGRAEQVGFLVAMVVLVLSFGSVVAAGLPLVTALCALAVGLSLLTLFANALDLSDFAPRLATLIGLGVGIDYALFIVTRYREGLTRGRSPDEAVAYAMHTSGRAVVFAGVTVVISLSGMFLMGIPLVRGLAVGAAVAVLAVLAATLTLVPAVLGFAGRSIERWHVPFVARRGGDAHRSVWYRWSRTVQRRPVVFTIVGFVVLLVLAAPVLAMRLGSADAGTDPVSATHRRAYDLLSDGFGPGFNGPLLLSVELGEAGHTADDLGAVTEAVAAVDGVAFVAPPQLNDTGDTAVVAAFPTTSPQDDRTVDLMHRLRDDVLPSVEASSGYTIHVGGVTALFQDLGATISQRLPVFIGAVIALSFLLLMVVFRSILIPLKAAVMNLLSIAAAYGVIVAVFQWGWAADLVGIDGTGPIMSFIPMILFAVLFGLSMDYEVFLLSRIREEYVRTGDNAEAVAEGLANTAKVITAAASIMVAVFGAAVLADDRTTKLFGLGLAVAVLVDATVVRTLLVPATMELLGDANWWLPRWLDRLLPRVSVEPADPVSDEAAAGDRVPAMIGAIE